MLPVHGRLTQFESALERDHLLLLDFSPLVVRVLEQPLTLTYLDRDTRPRRYTPDLLIEYVDRPSELCEVKYRVDIRESWSALKPKFRAARRFARENEIRFRIVTEVEIRTPFLSNVMFLRQYRDCPPDLFTREHLLSTLALLGETTPERLLGAAYWLEYDRLNGMTSVWQLLAEHKVVADMSQPLTMTSSIRNLTREERLWQRPHLFHLP